MEGFLNSFYLDPWTAKTGQLAKKECDLLVDAKKALEKNMTPDQQERRIMATINGTKVLIVVTREMPPEAG